MVRLLSRRFAASTCNYRPIYAAYASFRLHRPLLAFGSDRQTSTARLQGRIPSLTRRCSRPHHAEKYARGAVAKSQLRSWLLVLLVHPNRTRTFVYRIRTDLADPARPLYATHDMVLCPPCTDRQPCPVSASEFHRNEAFLEQHAWLYALPRCGRRT